jgi:hypothetical protein
MKSLEIGGKKALFVLHYEKTGFGQINRLVYQSLFRGSLAAPVARARGGWHERAERGFPYPLFFLPGRYPPGL